MITFNNKLNAHQFGPFVVRPDTVEEMRGWISDVGWGDQEEDPDFHERLSPEAVIGGVSKHYEGGVPEFLKGMGK